MTSLFKNKKILIYGVIALAVVAGWFSVSLMLFGAPSPIKSPQKEVFIISLRTKESDILDKLNSQGFIRNLWAFNLALTLKGKHQKIESGGYYLSKNMNVWQLIDKLTANPDMKWVVIPEGLRKEQIGEILARNLNWDFKQLNDWNNNVGIEADYLEGVYFPDTYLVPIKETSVEVAKRMINRFNEKFAPYFNKFSEKNIKWTTALKIASLIAREAGGKSDMSIIAGVIWNRLDKEMKLQIDATIQYAKGKVDGQWWSKVTPKDLEIDSLYNTYLYQGLPPQPIANPGLEEIEAVLNYEETDCFYYLHDHNKQIHCAVTYEEHLENIEKYLK